MTTQTAFYNLTLYDSSGDSSLLFSDFRAKQAGTGSDSNMIKIDTALSGLQTQISLFPAGIVYVPALQTGTNTYEALGITQLSSYITGRQIVLTVDVINTGASTLKINSLAAKTLKKYNQAGTLVDMADGDLVPARPLTFVYNGTYWVLVGSLDTSFPKSATFFHDESLVTVGFPLDVTLEGGQRYGHFVNQPAAIGDTFEQGFVITAGVYTLSVLGVDNANNGIATIYIDGVSIGDLDQYDGAGPTYNAIHTITSIAITGGYHKISFVINDKNPSSSDYYWLMTKFWLTPSAF